MYRSFLLLFFCLTVCVSVSGQACCSAFRDLGKKAFSQRNYDKALDYFGKAQACGDAAKCTDIPALISETKKAKADANKPVASVKPKPTPPSVSTPFVEPVMVKVEGGTFQMGQNDPNIGCNGCSKYEQPVHSVSVNTFYIGKYEVTQSEWRSVMGKNPPELSFKGCNSCPVDDVSWNDIQEFLKKLNAKTGNTYRLPTEAEWEYAARGGSKSNSYTYSGSNDVKSVAWFTENSDSKTHPVGQKQANELGIHDMSGNVWEWCSDWYDENYYKNSPVQNPKGAASGSRRVLRGGSWYFHGQFCGSSYRYYSAPGYRHYTFGFRLVLVP